VAVTHEFRDGRTIADVRPGAQLTISGARGRVFAGADLETRSGGAFTLPGSGELVIDAVRPRRT